MRSFEILIMLWLGGISITLLIICSLLKRIWNRQNYVYPEVEASIAELKHMMLCIIEHNRRIMTDMGYVFEPPPDIIKPGEFKTESEKAKKK